MPQVTVPFPRRACPRGRRLRPTEADAVAEWWKDDSRRDLPGLGSVLSALFGDRVQSPLARDALELVRSAVLETDPRSGYEILDRA